MTTEQLQLRLQGILKAITNFNPVQIESYIEDFIEDYQPGYTYMLGVNYLTKYETYSFEYFTWDFDKDGSIPGIKLFPGENIYLETNMNLF